MPDAWTAGSPAVLSIQSHVAYGMVGNRAAGFVLERAGFDCWAVPTVVFSSHAGHAGFKGRVTPADELANLLSPLPGLPGWPRLAAILTGYLARAASAGPVADCLAAAPSVPVLVDPVLGDDGRLYVEPALVDAYRERLLPLAGIATPNVFELETLTGQSAATLAGARAAAAALRMLGPRLVAVTSLVTPDLPEGHLSVLLDAGEAAWRIAVPRLRFAGRAPNGAGDAFSALLLARLVAGDAPPDALGHAVNALQAVLERALPEGGELPLVAAQAMLVDPPARFNIELLS